MKYSDIFKTKAEEILDWAEQYMSIAEDGFKCEMVWLSTKYNIAKDYIKEVEFADDTLARLAEYFLPLHKFSSQGLIPIWHEHQREQAKAVEGLGTGKSYVVHIPETDDLNNRFHKMLWMSKFGEHKLQATDELVQLVDTMQPTIRDEEVKKLFSKYLIGEVVTVEEVYSFIDNVELKETTYHEQLVACLLYKFVS